jgi:hypothetical protein
VRRGAEDVERMLIQPSRWTMAIKQMEELWGSIQ